MACQYEYNGVAYNESELRDLFEGKNKASDVTITKLKSWLSDIGVNYDLVKDIVVNGKKYDANGIADIASNLIQVVEGKENIALPEEAMHFGVEIIQQLNPSLYKQMLNGIGKYDIYNQTLVAYRGLKDYQLEDGKPNIPKIKKEAIGKLLAEHFIAIEEGTSTPTEQSKGWLQSIINFFKQLFSKYGNPFIQAISELNKVNSPVKLEGNETFLQSNEDLYNNIDKRLIDNNIQKIEDDKGSYYQKTVDGVISKIKRVTQIVKDTAGRKFKDNKVSDKNQKHWDEAAKYGSKGHKDIENIYERYLDDKGFAKRDATGQLTPSSWNGHTELGNSDIYNQLEQFVVNTINSFPEGTRFINEKVIYNPDYSVPLTSEEVANGYTKKGLAGTVDFIALTSDGKVNILDWKFVQLDKSINDDIPSYKREEWNHQMNIYKGILKSYGLKEEDFGKTRMMPIIISYDKYNTQGNIEYTPEHIEIPVAITIDTEKYYLPIPTQSERTGNKVIDSLITNLINIYNREKGKEAINNRKDIKNSLLNIIITSIRELQVRQNVKPLLQQVESLVSIGKSVIEVHDSFLKDGKYDPELFKDNKSISDFLSRVRNSQEELEVYKNLRTELRPFFKERNSPEDKENEQFLVKVNDDLDSLLSDLDEIDREFSQFLSHTKYGVDDLLKPERAVSWYGRNLMASGSGITQATAALSSMSNYAHNQGDKKAIGLMEKLIKIKSSGDNWKENFKLIKKEGKNQQIDEIDAQFFKDLKGAIENNDINWIKDNINIDEYNKAIEEYINKKTDIINNSFHEGTTEELQAWREKQIQHLKNDYEGENKYLLYGSANRLGVKDFVKKDLWYSEEFKKLQANPSALELYHFINDINKDAQRVGYLDQVRSKRTFLPFLPKTWGETMAGMSFAKVLDKALNSFVATADDTTNGVVDKVTGKPVRKIGRFLTQDNKGDYTEDLFMAYENFIKFYTNYEFTKEIEEQALQLERIERKKQSLAIERGNIKKDKNTGENILVDDNSVNSKFLSNQISSLVFHQRYIDDNLDENFGNLGKIQHSYYTVVNWFNKQMGKDLIPEPDYEHRQASLRKTVETMNRIFRLDRLGLNIGSSVVNFLGGNLQTGLAAKKFSVKEFTKHEFRFQFRRFEGEEGQKYLAIVDAFMPLLENPVQHEGKKLRLNKLQQYSMSGALLSLQTGGDKIIQLGAAGALIDNLMVRDGKLVNIREYLKDTEEYKKRYDQSLTEVERLQSMKDFDFEGKVKELQKENLFNTATIDENGHAQFGVSEDEIFNQRNIIREINSAATGNLSPTQVRGINQSVFGTSFMMFKNWIPKLAEARFSKLNYNKQLEEYEIGKTRQTLGVILQQGFFSMETLKFLIGQHSIAKNNDKGLSMLNALYEDTKKKYEDRTGKEFKMDKYAFFEMTRENLKSQFRETMLLVGLLGIYLSLKLGNPDPDDTEEQKSFYRFSLKNIDKLSNELDFYYNPLSVQTILNGSVFPALGVLTDGINLVKNIGQEGLGVTAEALGSEDFGKEQEKKAHPIKALMKVVPGASYFSQLMPLFAPQMSKDMGLKITATSGIR